VNEPQGRSRTGLNRQDAKRSKTDLTAKIAKAAKKIK
jgi:hypothetical protein